MVLRVLLMFLSLCSVRNVQANCFKEDITWFSSGVLDILEPIADPYVCQQLCVNLDDCSAFTWTTDDNMGLKLSCFLFASISNHTTCKDCISGPASCTCSSNLACSADADNIIDVVPGVELERDCQDFCSGSPSCMMYTW